jgi:hypothetical protein
MLKSKKGFLMFAVTIIFMLIMVSAVVVFFVDRPNIESDMKLGKTLLSIYETEDKANEIYYYIEKAGEYSLFNALNETVSSGVFGGVNCEVENGREVMFSNLDCVFNDQKFKENISSRLNKSFDKYLNDINISSKDFNFDINLKNDELILIGESDKQLQFSDNKKLSFKKNVSFEKSLDFNFSEYSRSFDVVVDELNCFEKFMDFESQKSIGDSKSIDVSSCFTDKGYFEFLEVELVGDVLFYKYKMKGVLFEENFVIGFAIDLNGLRGVMGPKNIAFIT